MAMFGVVGLYFCQIKISGVDSISYFVAGIYIVCHC